MSGTKLEQAARQALEALKFARTQIATLEIVSLEDACDEAITALREALAGDNMSPTEQAEQEPVAWMQDSIELYVKDRPDNWHTIPLYAAPVRIKDLTDDEIHKCMNGNFYNALDFARAVIAADREKNKCQPQS